MARPTKGGAVYNGLVSSLKEVAAHQRGETKLNSYFIPGKVDVKSIRAKLGLSQADFAERFGFSVRTLQDWELGRNQPPGPVRCYLLVIEQEPKRVERILREQEAGSKPAPARRGVAVRPQETHRAHLEGDHLRRHERTETQDGVTVRQASWLPVRP
jgi:putative transcriptional regulator